MDLNRFKQSCSFFFALPMTVVVALTCAPLSLAKHKSGDIQPSDVMKREEMMVMNLTRGQKSAKTYLFESLKSIKEIEDNLERAQHQVEQVDAAYAKIRRHPDDRTMQTT